MGKRTITIDGVKDNLNIDMKYSKVAGDTIETAKNTRSKFLKFLLK